MIQFATCCSRSRNFSKRNLQTNTINLDRVQSYNVLLSWWSTHEKYRTESFACLLLVQACKWDQKFSPAVLTLVLLWVITIFKHVINVIVCKYCLRRIQAPWHGSFYFILRSRSGLTLCRPQNLVVINWRIQEWNVLYCKDKLYTVVKGKNRSAEINHHTR